MKFQTERKHLVAFSYASLTDVVLQLLIFFLLSSTFVIQSGVKVQLPRAAHQEHETKGQIVIVLTADGTVFLNGQQVLKAELQSRVASLLKNVHDPVVLLEADKNVTLQQTVEVMDIAKAAGTTRFIIATQPLDRY